MNNFAKLFDTKIGQVLCVLDMSGDEDGAAITFTCKPKNFGLCSTKINFSDTDKGSKAAQRCFNRITEKMALEALKDVLELVGERS
ncbi:MAG: hypothetical protein U5L02_16400 [Rheinheimera sp.]|nr:hypothetical protein [Rheinheimera sp.]